jgi:hypothetical protein
MLCDHPQYGFDLARAKATVARELYQIQSRLRRGIVAIDMDMRRLARLVAEKVAAIGAETQDGRHRHVPYIDAEPLKYGE